MGNASSLRFATLRRFESLLITFGEGFLLRAAGRLRRTLTAAITVISFFYALSEAPSLISSVIHFGTNLQKRQEVANESVSKPI